MRSDRPTVTVVIPAYNEERTIGATVSSVLAQTRPPDQVIVVDDGSTDRTGEIAAQFGATVIRPPSNTGTKAQAQNLALPHAVGEIVVVLDADTVLVPDALEKLLEPFEDPGVAAACSFILPQRIATSWERGRFIEYLFGLTFAKAVQNRFRTVLVCSGCFSAYRRSVLERYGGFRPRTMAEDMDLTWELHAHGERVVFVRQALCLTLDPPSWPVFRGQIERWARAFYQNIRVHRRTLMRNPRLGLLVAIALLDILSAPLYGLTILASLLWGRLDVLAWVAATETLCLAVPTLVGAWRMKRLPEALWAMPWSLLTRLAALWIYWRALVQEWVLRKPLVVWEKGH